MMKRDTIRLVTFILCSFIGHQGFAQEWELRMMTSLSMASGIYDAPNRSDILVHAVNDVSLGVLIKLDSSFYVGASIGTFDYNTITVDQGNIAVGILIEYRFLPQKRVNFGLTSHTNLTKNQTAKFVNGIYSNVRMGFGFGANVKFKFTDDLGLLLQYVFHQDFYTERAKGDNSFLGKRQIVSIGVSHAFD